MTEAEKYLMYIRQITADWNRLIGECGRLAQENRELKEKVLTYGGKNDIIEKRGKTNYIQLDNGRMAGSYSEGGGGERKVDVDKSEENGIINIGKSLSAAAKNYPVKLLDTNQRAKLAEGQTIQGTVFAGNGTNVEIRDRYRLESDYHVPADKWKKLSGKGRVIRKGKETLAELHWYEADGEIYEMKVKRYLDES